MKNKLSKNYILNLTYQIIALIIPLITTPYLSKILGVDKIGEYSFTYSLANYFLMLSALGFGTYAQREIAKFQNDKYNISLIFWEIFIIKSIMTFIAVILNLILILLNVYGKYTVLMMWWMILILSNLADINYLFSGLEEFAKIVYKNLLVKFLSIICIFVFVKNQNDVWVYILIYSSSILFGNISMWKYLSEYLVKIDLCKLNPLKHLGISFKLFIPTIATSLYAYLDKTMIGLLARNPDFENGCYEQSEKIVKMATTIIISLGTVMIPRNTMLYSLGKKNELTKNLYFASEYVWGIGLPIMFGLLALSSHIVPWFLGDEFHKSILLIQILSPLVIFMGFGNVFGLQYLVPAKKDTKWTLCIISGLFVNIIVNMCLISKYNSFGAALGTLAAEGTVAISMGLVSKNFLNLRKILLSSYKYLISSLCMYFIILSIKSLFSCTFISCIMLTLIGAIIYISILYILKEKYILYIISLIKKFL